MLTCRCKKGDFVEFNRSRNRSKSASSLLGIINGLTSDKVLNDTEILYLQAWTEEQDEHTGDVLDILDFVNTILSDGKIELDERNELLELLTDCIDYGDPTDTDDAKINEMIGFLNGIIADGEVNSAEFEALINKIDSYKLSDRPPIDKVKVEIEKILKDGIVEREELESLCDYLKHVTGTDFTSDGDAVGGATTLFDEKIEFIEGKHICLTGVFINGQRKEIASKLETHASIVQKNVTQKTDIVVVGTLSNKDWVHSSSGRKIEKALQLKKDGFPIVITNEKRLFSVLRE